LNSRLRAKFYAVGNGLTLVRQAGRRSRLAFFRQIAVEWTSSAATSAGSAGWDRPPPLLVMVERTSPDHPSQARPHHPGLSRHHPLTPRRPKRTNRRAPKSVAHYRRRTGATGSALS